MFSGTQHKCKVCKRTVYLMDQLNTDGVVYHKSCFKCNHCKGTLKLSNYCSMEGILYCKPHFEQLFKETGSYNKSFQQSVKSSEQSTPTNPMLTSSPIKADDWIPEVRPELTNSPATLSSVTAEMVTPELTNSPATLSAVTAEMVTPEPTRPPRKVEKPTPELSRSFSKAEKLTPELTRSPSKAAGVFLGTQEKCATCGKTAYPLEKVTVEGQSYHKTCFKCFHGGCSLSPSNYAALEGIIYCKPHFSQLFKEKGSYNHLIKCASIKRG